MLFRSSKEKIKKVEVGIVIGATKKWSAYKYVNSKVDSNTFDLAEADSKLFFSRLAGGDYYYRVYVHTESGVVTLLNEKFTVKPSDKPSKAVAWAKRIAADNSFTYGTGSACHRSGCYFCGTNKTKKPKGYERTYVCMTFTGAAYAHGAGDPDILKACQTGRMTMNTNNQNFTDFTCWMKVGSCKDLTIDDLMPGDVLIKWGDGQNGASSHAVIYGGGDLLIEAMSEGWGADSISAHGGAAKRLQAYASDSRNYVMRYNR